MIKMSRRSHVNANHTVDNHKPLSDFERLEICKVVMVIT